MLAQELAPILDQLYPSGARWLENRLDDIELGDGRASIVRHNGLLAGVSIETPKEIGRIKLSTLWVHPAFRGSGVGRALLDNCRNEWLRSETSRVDVTCASTAASSLAPLLHSSGFSLERVCRDRYGEGRHEVVFSWFAEADPTLAGRHLTVSPAPVHAY